MNTLDLVIIAIYLVGLLLLGRMFRNNQNSKDYFLGGKQFGWLSLSISTLATQLSAISFVSAPAFVGLKEGGGMTWLTYEFAVPLAMIFLMVFLIPTLYTSGVVSVYAYLEKRFGRSTRLLLSGVFQISRAFGTSVMIYAIALILTSVMAIPMWMTILLIGIVTLIYSLQGGMKAVVYGDVIQMVILFAGMVICLFFGLQAVGGWDAFLQQVDPARLEVVNFDKLGFQKGEEFGFWPMLLGGFFLYASYYGTDQSQVQRLFSAPNLPTLKKTLLWNGLLRFPITLVYCIMGLVIGTLVVLNPEFAQEIPSNKPDLMIPVFIRDFLPHGVIGILMVAIFSAAMSSLSSAVNSLSAASVEDFFASKKELSDKEYMRYSKYTVLFWGVLCIGFAFFTGDIAETVIEAINKVGSLFYGPILATFVAAVGIKKIHGKAANIGLLLGVAVNVYLWLFVPSIFWFWWNAVGAVVTLGSALLFSYLLPGKGEETATTDWSMEELPWRKIGILLLFFVAIIVFSIKFPSFFS
ncbi:sodium:solute symporter [Lewinella cohaerens]|uniref:sodium:solute symporter n=1 Tax=Lewinella cohaerens TaxID=70995 RepID=UPI00036C16E4|nr:sodium:solute symporter [Lewinella cohaerens]